jgi:hypothetical protein
MSLTNCHSITRVSIVCLLTGGPPSVGVGLPRDQADGVESSEGACGCDMAGYSIGLLPTRYVEEAPFVYGLAFGQRDKICEVVWTTGQPTGPLFGQRDNGRPY